ncbi:MAG: NADH-quinone oxidoreductase subunit J [Ignavibacteriales bacterium]|nr:NADH-quinone oxidoreductase subunit J [Ignavibacteriales bacterium]
MSLYNLAFYFFTLITLASASVVVFSKNIVHSAFALLFTFFGVAGLYVLMMADFLAITQILIYIGGIMVLVLFGVMLTNRTIDVQIRTRNIQTFPALLIVAALAGTLIGIFWSTDWKISPMAVGFEKTAPAIGKMLLTSYLLPFEIASIVLLVALIGAAMIARREKKA